MGERRYGVGSRGRSPSPRRPPPRSRDFSPLRHRRSPPPRHPPPRSRDFSPLRHRKFSPYHRRETEEYSREAETSRRVEKRDHMDRDSGLRAPRFTEYDNGDRDRDGYVFGGRELRSPGRTEKRDNCGGLVRFSDYGDGAKGKYENGVSVGRLRRSYDEDIYHGDSSSMKFQPDHLLDGPSRDHLRVKDYGLTLDFSGICDTNVTSSRKRDYYLQNHYLDSGRGGLLPESQYLDSTEPVSIKYESMARMHSHSYTLTHAGVDDNPISSAGGGVGGSHMSSVSSRYLDTDTNRQRYLNFRDELHLNRRDVLNDREDNYFEKKNSGSLFHDRSMGIGETVEREMYKFKKEDNPLPSRGYLKGDSEYMVSSYHPQDYDPVPSGILSEGFPCYSSTRDLHMPSTVIRQGSGLASQPIVFDGYSEKKPNIFPKGPGGQLDDKRSPSSYTGLPEEKQGNLSYAEFGRSKTDSMRTRLDDVEEGYRDQHISRVDVLSHRVGECSHRKHMGDDGLWDQYPSFPVQSTHDKFDTHGLLHGRKLDLDMLVTGSSRLDYGTEGYSGYGGVKPEEHHDDMAGGQWSHFERSDLLQSRGYDPSFSRLYDSPRKRSPMADLSLVEPLERRLRDKHVRDEILYEHDVGIRISTDGNGARKIYNQVDVEDEIDLVHLSKKPRSSRSDYAMMWSEASELADDQPSSSKFHPHCSIVPHKSDSRDIKKRLGPVHRKLHVSQRLKKKYKPSIKKRLAPAPPKKHATLPWLKKLSSNVMASEQNESDGGPHDHDGDQLGDNHPPPKREPPEKSEEFKQLVQSAFFKFLKQINETPMKRKKYMEQQKAGILKCIVCGSNSEEFVGTEGLAMHAFTSKQVGLRSPHLGLCKALCALMGWKIAEEPSSLWHCQVMTNAETSALKEDLIIWPPVVIVHNSTIDNTNPDERVIISTEKLDSKLREMGFGSILKVCNGKPANQSVMLVKFNGTLSGLQEAERLHQSYVESKHGRAELEQLKSRNRSSRGGRQVISPEEGENYLYGHLGIAEDLDKLDFDTKKRCILRSKKQILSIVDAPLDTLGETTGCN